MFSFFKKYNIESGIRANIISVENGFVTVDVRNQTCPGYLLSINKAVEKFPKGTIFKLKITYPPCGEDVESYCRQKSIEFLGMETTNEGIFIIQIKK